MKKNVVLEELLRSKMGRMLAIDPGATTGFALFDQQEPIRSHSWEKTCTHDELVQELVDAWPNIIVCESFVHTHKTGIDYTPVEYIGLIKWFASRRDVIYIEQTPSYGKGFFDNDKLKKLGVYVAGLPHSMDALRHLYQFMTKHGLFDLRLLK